MNFFIFKQKTAYEMRISDLSSVVCSSDLSHPESRFQPFSCEAGEGGAKRRMRARAKRAALELLRQSQVKSMLRFASYPHPPSEHLLPGTGEGLPGSNSRHAHVATGTTPVTGPTCLTAQYNSRPRSPDQSDRQMRK